MAVSVPDPSLVAIGVPAALKDVLLRAHLTDAPAPTLFQVTSSAGDLAGQVTVTQGPRLSVVGQVWSRFLDVDLLRGLPPAVGGATRGGDATGTEDTGRIGEDQGTANVPLALLSPGLPPRAADVPAVPPGSASSPDVASSAPKPRAAPMAGTGPLIPDTKLPFDLIRAADGNLAFNLGELHIDGASVRKIEGVVSAKDGLLRVDPLTISALAQRLSGILVVDTAKTPPLVHTEFTAPGLAVFPLLAAIGLPRMATGHLAVRADLTGSGDTPRALAASVSGWLGMAVEDGQVDARLIGFVVGPLAAAARRRAPGDGCEVFRGARGCEGGGRDDPADGAGYRGADHRGQWRRRPAARDPGAEIAASGSDWRDGDRSAGAGDGSDARPLGQDRHFVQGAWEAARWRV